MYIDGFVVPVKRDRIEEYVAMGREMAALWIKQGAQSVVEAMGDDFAEGEVRSFPRAVRLEPGEAAFFTSTLTPTAPHATRAVGRYWPNPVPPLKPCLQVTRR